MADPLSAAASIVAVVQISQAVLSTCYQYISSVKNAPREIHKAAAEVGSLQVILRDLRLLVASASAETSSSLPSLQKAVDAANGPVKTCQTALLQLKELLGSPAHLTSMGRAIVWPWKEKAVYSILEHLQRQKECIVLALSTDQTYATLEIRQDLKELKTSLEQERVLAWLSKVDPSSNHNAACERHEPLTGNWLLNSDEFNEYIHGDEKWLWCYGIPGCGKTILFSTIVEYVKAIHNSLPDTQYAYFYFDFNDAEKQSPNGMLRSILKHLANQNSGILEEVESLYSRCGKGHQQPQRGDLLRIWSSIKDGNSKTYILLDALDECSDRENLMQLLLDIKSVAGNNVCLLATSRKERDIELGMSNIEVLKVALETSKVDPDIKLYVRHSLASDNRLRKWPDPVKDNIESTLAQKAQGMFRWVVCQLSVLRRCLKLSVLETALQQLPKTLDETYDRILSNIPEDYRNEAIAALRWLAFSCRPMTLNEVAEAVVIRPDGFKTSERLLDPFDILEICSSLVVLGSSENEESDDGIEFPETIEAHGTKELRLAHFSVKEFLLSERIAQLSSDAQLFALLPDTAHIELARACLRYLTSDYFETGACETRVEFEERRKEFPLLDYAVNFWHEHIKELGVEKQVHDLLVQFLVPQKSKFLATAMQASHGYINDFRPCDGNDFKIFNSYRGKAGGRIERTESIALNSLAVAVATGCNSVLSLIIDSGADINAFGSDNGNALQTAVEAGNYEAVVTLLDLGADINFPGQTYGTALMRSIKFKHESIMNLLLHRGADPTMTGQGAYGTALSVAAYIGNADMIGLLLTRYPRVAEHWPNAMAMAIHYNRVESVAVLMRHRPKIVSNEVLDRAFVMASNRDAKKELQQCFINAGYQPPNSVT